MDRLTHRRSAFDEQLDYTHGDHQDIEQEYHNYGLYKWGQYQHKNHRDRPAYYPTIVHRRDFGRFSGNKPMNRYRWELLGIIWGSAFILWTLGFGL